MSVGYLDKECGIDSQTTVLHMGCAHNYPRVIARSSHPSMLPAVTSKLVTDVPYALLEEDNRHTETCTLLHRPKKVPDCSGTVSSPEIRGCSRSVPDEAGCRGPPAAMSLCASSHLLLAFLASSCQSTCSIEPKHSTAAHHPTFIHSCKQQILR